MLNKNLFEVSYLKLNISDTRISWEGVPYWKIITENQHTFNGTEEKTDSLKLSSLKNHTFAFDLT